MRKKIGTFLVEKGYLTQEQVREVRVYSEKTGKKFGDAALALGYITDEQLKEVFGDGFKTNFFHIDTKTFPRTTLDLFPVEEVVIYGCMPLGFKTEMDGPKELKVLNLGFLDPEDDRNTQGVLQLIKEKSFGKNKPTSVDPYLLLPENFVEVICNVYGLKKERYGVLAKGELYPMVRELLDAKFGMSTGKAGKKAA